MVDKYEVLVAHVLATTDTDGLQHDDQLLGLLASKGLPLLRHSALIAESLVRLRPILPHATRELLAREAFDYLRSLSAAEVSKLAAASYQRLIQAYQPDVPAEDLKDVDERLLRGSSKPERSSASS